MTTTTMDALAAVAAPPRPPASAIERLLRDRRALVADIVAGRSLASIARAMLATIVLGGALFGAALGLYRGGVQIAYAALKLPMVLVFTAALAAPALTAFNLALDRPADLRRDLALALGALALGALVLAAEAPLIFVARALDAEYHQTTLLVVGSPSVAGAARWQRVRHGGTLGWVNARFLSPHDSAELAQPPGAKPASFALLAPLICFGTEPFWAIRFGADGSASYEAMGEVPASSSIAQLRTNPSGDPESFDLLTADRGMVLRAAMRKTGRCSDGMSDLIHPYEFTGVGTPGALSGCCRIEKASPGEPRP